MNELPVKKPFSFTCPVCMYTIQLDQPYEVHVCHGQTVNLTWSESGDEVWTTHASAAVVEDEQPAIQAVTREQFLERLRELFHDANARLEWWDQYGGDEQYCGKEWSICSTNRDEQGHPWEIMIDKELQSVISACG